MITLHHIANSRSQRVLWMLEELELDYELITHSRDAESMLALKTAHRLGKAPTVMIDGQIMAESGAIVSYLAERHGLSVAIGDPRRRDYLSWMHFSEASLMPLFTLGMHARRLGPAATELPAYADSEVEARLVHMDAELAGRDWLLGDSFTAADVQNGYAIDVAFAGKRDIEVFANIRRYRDKFRARPAYRRALEKGGPYTLGQVTFSQNTPGQVTPG